MYIVININIKKIYKTIEQDRPIFSTNSTGMSRNL